MSEVRAIFDALLARYPEMNGYISKLGKIVHSPNFETGLVKLQDDEWEDLSTQEGLLMRPFLLENSEADVRLISPTKPTTLAAAALKTKKSCGMSLRQCFSHTSNLQYC